MAFKALEGLDWFPFSDDPLIPHAWYLPRLEAPALVSPSDSPDGSWHLFARSWAGLQHLTSSNGIAWTPAGRLSFQGRNPHVTHVGALWYLTYEARMQGRSTLVSRTSGDLLSFSPERVLLDGGDLEGSDGFLSCPVLLSVEGSWRLYFTSRRTEKDETGWESWRELWYASSPGIDGPYRRPVRVLETDPDDPLANMAIGTATLVECQEGVAALTCGRRWNTRSRSCDSSLMLWLSKDGVHFFKEEELVPMPRWGWASGGVTQASLVWQERERCWYCYYAAVDRSPIGHVSIGLLISGRNGQPEFPSQTV